MVNQNYFSGGTENKKVAVYREEKVIPKTPNRQNTVF